MFTRLTAILLATFTVALHSQANTNLSWDYRFIHTNDIPPRIREGTNTIFANDVLAWQTLYAIYERNWAVTKAADWQFANNYLQYTNVRFPERTLQETKNRVKYLLPFFIDKEKTTNGPNDLVFWSVTSMVDRLNLPTNFFDFTPVRNLTGNNWSYTNLVNTNAVSSHASNMAYIGKVYGWSNMYHVVTNMIWTYQVEFFTTKSNVFSGEMIEIKEEAEGVEAPQFYCDWNNPNVNLCSSTNEVFGPYALTSLTIENLVSNQFAIQNYIATPFFIETGPFTKDVGIYQQWYDDVKSGHPAAYLFSPSGKIYMNATGHIAETWRRNVGGTEFHGGDVAYSPSVEWRNLYSNCFDRPYGPSGYTNIQWKYIETITNIVELADTNSILHGSFQGISPSCELCDFFELSISYDPGEATEIDEIVCGNDVFAWWYGFAYFFEDAKAIRNIYEYGHLIKWNFYFK